MPLAAHPKDDRGDSQYGHDDASCKEIAIPVGAALNGAFGLHDESGSSSSLRFQSLSFATDFPRCSELPHGKPKKQTIRPVKWYNGGGPLRLKSKAWNTQSTWAPSILLLEAQRSTPILHSGMSKIQGSTQVPVPCVVQSPNYQSMWAP